MVTIKVSFKGTNNKKSLPRARASRIDDAFRVFNEMPIKNTVSWTALVAGYKQRILLTSALGQWLEQWLSSI
jgi:hypothetical protein